MLNFAVNSLTNAHAKSFNTKIKAFRASLRGITDIKFFLFRFSNIYA
ncbi:MAG: transposase [Prevotellaceae bacterium]|nr:transposase [Prevotellaceae bacterium]